MSAEDVLFHGKEVKLVSGEYIAVNPWGVKTGQRMMARIKTIFILYRTLSGGEGGLEELLDTSYTELVSIAADSIKLKMKDLEDETRFTLEDLISILSAIVEVNFTSRPEFVAKIKTLFGLLNEMMGGGGDEKAEEETTTSSPSPESSNS